MSVEFWSVLSECASEKGGKGSKVPESGRRVGREGGRLAEGAGGKNKKWMKLKEVDIKRHREGDRLRGRQREI